MKITLAVFFPILSLLATVGAKNHGAPLAYTAGGLQTEYAAAVQKTVINDYPFSDIINWGTDSRQRKDYEKYLGRGSVVISSSAVVHQDDKIKIAEKEEFLLVKKNGVLIGYGVIFTELKFSGYAINRKEKDTREIALNKVEIFYDLLGRHIFLASYRTKGLSNFEMWMAKRLGHKPEAFRRDIDINNLDLGEGYEFDEKSRKLVRFLLDFPKACKNAFDKNGLADGKLTVLIDEKVFNNLGK